MDFRVMCILSTKHTEDVQAMIKSYDNAYLEVIHRQADGMSIRQVCRSLDADLIIYDPDLDNGALLAEIGKMPDPPRLICISANAGYMAEAFDAAAVHYLTPTAEPSNLHIALDRAITMQSSLMTGAAPAYASRNMHAKRMMEVEARYHHRPASEIVALPTNSIIDVHRTENIVRIEGAGNYSKVFFLKDAPAILCRTIGNWEVSLSSETFVRIHRSHIVNVAHIRKIIRGRPHRVKLLNGDEVDVSEKYKDGLYSRITLIERQTA